MLNVHISNSRQDLWLDHESGPLELGRGPRRMVPRLIIDDAFVSRDHLQLDELSGGRLRVTNLSRRRAIELPDGSNIGVGQWCEFFPPVRFPIGNTKVEVDVLAGESLDQASFQTLSQPATTRGLRRQTSLRDLGESPSAGQLAGWLGTVLAVQSMPGGSREFYDETARALVELIGLDLGMVLVKRADRWEIVGHHAIDGLVNSRYSRTLLHHVLQQRQTYYQDFQGPVGEGVPGAGLPPSESLQEVAAVVASPIFGLAEDVIGVLYGSRRSRLGRKPGIRPLEAQVVQLLAAGVGANLARTTATRTRVQFEQFFSPELVRELERDSRLLEGRDQEVTILVSDLRGFTRMSEQLEPEASCRIVREVMERLSDRIVAEGGVIVDYAGDGIFAMWNAPLPQEDHVARACRAALAMRDEFAASAERWNATCEVPLALGVGINTGPARVGNTGSSRKLKYGPHGLTVNLASRIQDATKRFAAPLLVSDAVRHRLPPSFTTREMGPAALPGISGEVRLHELLAEANCDGLGATAEARVKA